MSHGSEPHLAAADGGGWNQNPGGERAQPFLVSGPPILNLWLPGGFAERVASKALYQTVLWVGAPAPPSALREPAEGHSALARCPG